MSHRSQIYLTTSEPQQAGADLTFSGRKTWKVSATREKRPFYLKARSPTAALCRQRRAASAGQGWAAGIAPGPAATAGSCPRRAEPGRRGDNPRRRHGESAPRRCRGHRPQVRPRRRLPRVPRPAEPGASLAPAARTGPPRPPHPRLPGRATPPAPPPLPLPPGARPGPAGAPHCGGTAPPGGGAGRRAQGVEPPLSGETRPRSRRPQGRSVWWAGQTPGVRTAEAHCMAVFPLALNQFGGKRTAGSSRPTRDPTHRVNRPRHRVPPPAFP